MAQGRSKLTGLGFVGRHDAFFENAEVPTKAEQVLYKEALDRISELSDARNARLVEAGEGIPTVLWGMLVVGEYLLWVSPTYLTWRIRLCTL
jgi:hypothetical protein